MSTSSSNNRNGNGTKKLKRTRTYRTKGHSYPIPPRLIGESIKLYRFSLGNLGAIIAGLLIFLGYMVFVPFPEFLSAKLVIAGALGVGSVGFFIFPIGGGLTGFEWAIIALNYKIKNIPGHTRARPVQRQAGQSAAYNNSPTSRVTTVAVALVGAAAITVPSDLEAKTS